MPKFSLKSKERLNTCHPDLRKVCEEVIRTYDFSVTCGHRNKKEQDEAYRKGNSNVRYPNSAHNKIPSLAVDIVPYPVDWNDIGRFRELAAAFMAVASVLKERGEITSDFVWGGNWKTLKDYPHFEVKEK